MATVPPSECNSSDEELSYDDSDFSTSEESNVDESTLNELEKKEREYANQQYSILAKVLELDPNTDKKVILEKTIDVMNAGNKLVKQFHQIKKAKRAIAQKLDIYMEEVERKTNNLNLEKFMKEVLRDNNDDNGEVKRKEIGV